MEEIFNYIKDGIKIPHFTFCVKPPGENECNKFISLNSNGDIECVTDTEEKTIELKMFNNQKDEKQKDQIVIKFKYEINPKYEINSEKIQKYNLIHQL